MMKQRHLNHNSWLFRCAINTLMPHHAVAYMHNIFVACYLKLPCKPTFYLFNASKLYVMLMKLKEIIIKRLCITLTKPPFENTCKMF